MNVSLRRDPKQRGSINVLMVALILASALANISGCAEVRKVTYTEGFTYLEDKEVDSMMRKMGKGVNRLGQLVEKASPTDKTQQQLIITELNELQSIATHIGAGAHTQTNQLFISDHIEQFITDIETAEMHAKTTPPDYSETEEIVRSCQECHKLR